LDSDYSAYNIFGGMNLTSASGAITLDAANAVGSFAPRVSFGQVNASTNGRSPSSRPPPEPRQYHGGELGRHSVTGPVVDSGNLTIGAAGATFTTTSGQSIVIDGALNVIPTLNVSGGLTTWLPI